jgi:hypothetical protein
MRLEEGKKKFGEPFERKKNFPFLQDKASRLV